MVVISPLVEIGADVKVYTGFFENDESLTKALVGRLWWLFFAFLWFRQSSELPP